MNKLKRRLRALFHKQKLEQELDDELRFHLEKEVEQNLARGMNAEEARWAALRSFGGVEQVKEESRDVRGVRWLEDLWQDLRYSLRVLLQKPGFTLTVIITLALGIGANTAIFSVVNAVLLRELPFKNPDQVVWVWSTRTDRDKAPFTLPDFLDYRDQNQTLEQIAAFSSSDAVGARIQIDDNDTGPRPVEIVGVVGDVKHVSLEDKPTFDMYLPIAQIHEDSLAVVTNSQYWILRSNLDTRSLEAGFQRELRSIDADVASSNVRTMETYLADSVASRRFNLRLLTIFAVAALLLAATGVYGVVSYSVAQRTPEIGIRLALGASRKNIFGIVLGQGLRLVVAGLAFGLLGAFGLTRMIRSLMFGVTPNDPFTFVVVAALLIVIAIAAGGLPALRATKLDPLRALRE